MSGPPPPYPGAEGGYPPANTAYAPDSKMGPGPPPAGNLPFSFFNFFFYCVWVQIFGFTTLSSARYVMCDTIAFSF